MSNEQDVGILKPAEELSKTIRIAEQRRQTLMDKWGDTVVPDAIKLGTPDYIRCAIRDCDTTIIAATAALHVIEHGDPKNAGLTTQLESIRHDYNKVKIRQKSEQRRIQQLEEAANELGDRIAGLRAEKRTLEKKVESLEQAGKDLLEEKQEAIRTRDKFLVDSNKQVAELQETLSLARRANYQILDEKRLDQSAVVKELMAEVDSVGAKLESSEQWHREQRDKNAKLKEENSKFRTLVGEQRVTIDDMQGQIDTLTKSKAVWKRRLRVEEANVEDLEAKLAELPDSEGESTEAFWKWRVEVEKTRAEELEEHVKARDKVIADKEQTITDLQTIADGHASDAQQLQEQSDSLKGRVKGVEDLLKSTQEENEELKNQRDIAVTSGADVLKARDELLVENDKLKKKLQANIELGQENNRMAQLNLDAANAKLTETCQRRDEAQAAKEAAIRLQHKAEGEAERLKTQLATASRTELEREVEKHQKSAEFQKKQNDKLRGDVEKHQGIANELRAKHAEAERNRDAAEVELSNVKAEINKLKFDYTEENKAKQDGQDVLEDDSDYANLQRDYGKLYLDHQKLKLDREAAEVELGNVKRDSLKRIGELEVEIKNLKEVDGELRGDRREAQQLLDERQIRIEELEGEVERLKKLDAGTLRTALEIEREDHQTELDNLNGEVEKWKSKHAETDAHNVELGKRLANVRSDYATMRNSNVELAEDSNQLSKKMADLEEERDRIAKEATRIRDEYDILQEAYTRGMHRRDVRIMELDDALKGARAEGDQKTDDALKESEKRIEGLQLECFERQHDANQLRVRLNELGNIETEFKAEREKCEALHAENSKLYERNFKLANEDASSRQALKDAQKEINRLKNELLGDESRRASYQSLSERNDELHQQNADLSKDLAETKIALDAAETNWKSCRDSSEDYYNQIAELKEECDGMAKELEEEANESRQLEDGSTQRQQ